MLPHRKSRKPTTLLLRSFTRIPIKMPKQRISLPMHSQHMSYYRTPRKKKRGISMVPQPLIKALDSTPAAAVLADRSEMPLAQADFKASAEASGQTSTSKTFLVLSQGVGGEAAAPGNLRFKKKFLWDRTLKYRPTSPSWMRPKGPTKTYSSLL